MPRLLATGCAWFAIAVSLLVAQRTPAAELPPERPTTGYAATIRNTQDTHEAGRFDSEGDTVEVRVSGRRLWEKSRILRKHVAIVDLEAGTVIEVDPDAADRVAHRFGFAEQPMPYVDGRAAFGEDWGPARVAGQEKVAKHACTLLHYGDPDTEGIAACVSAEGVVLRARIKLPDFEREFELLDFEPGPQAERWFQPPEGFRVEDARAK